MTREDRINKISDAMDMLIKRIASINSDDINNISNYSSIYEDLKTQLSSISASIVMNRPIPSSDNECKLIDAYDEALVKFIESDFIDFNAFEKSRIVLNIILGL